MAQDGRRQLLLGRSTLVALAVALLAAPGCETPTLCPAGFIGDRAATPEIVLLATDGTSGVLAPVAPGGQVLIKPPPQGGYVLYVGAQVRNVDACNIELRGRMSDPKTGEQIGFDARTTDLLLGGDGWGRPDPSNNANVANVNACPHYKDLDLHGHPYTLEMTATDAGGRRATVSQTVTPTCQFTDAREQRDCECTCGANYMLGKCDFRDGGL